ncbi:MAG TPA: hypothetical protein VFX78_11550 [Candidatus Eisenbacteria bacterium]|jgi:hypothetical protein|nr:hypothetical protein [Candidatus Eisenbacteria bacterium]
MQTLTRIAILAALALGPSYANAQLGTSAWSLEMGTRLGSASTFEFSTRRHLGASNALRLGVAWSFDQEDGDGTTVGPGFPDRARDELSEQNAITASLDWMRFAPIRSNVTATFAVGPSVQLSRSMYRSETGGGTPAFNGYELKYETATLGLEVLIGAEWHFVDRLSLGGAAGVGGRFGARHESTVERSGTGPAYEKFESRVESDIVAFETLPARIYLSAYF